MRDRRRRLTVTWCPPASTASVRGPVRARRSARQRFDRAADGEVRTVALAVRDMLRGLRTLLGDVPYNVVVNTAPAGDDRPFHWWIDIMPRLAVHGRIRAGDGPGRVHRRTRRRRGRGAAARPRVTVTVGDHDRRAAARACGRSSSPSRTTSSGWPTPNRSRSRASNARRRHDVRVPDEDRPVPHGRPHGRDRMGTRAGHGHRAPRPVHRTGRFTLARSAPDRDALHVDRGHPLPVVARRTGSARVAAEPVLRRVWLGNLRRLDRLVTLELGS